MLKLTFTLCIILSAQKRIYYKRYEEDPINSYEKCQGQFCQNQADKCFSDNICMFTQHNCFSKYYSKESSNYETQYYQCVKSNFKAEQYLSCMEAYCKQDLISILQNFNKNF